MAWMGGREQRIHAPTGYGLGRPASKNEPESERGGGREGGREERGGRRGEERGEERERERVWQWSKRGGH